MIFRATIQRRAIPGQWETLKGTWPSFEVTSLRPALIAFLTVIMLTTPPQALSQCLGASTIVDLYPCKLLRRCDSRNLNLSPLCGLDSSSSALKLQPTVEATYRSKGISPPYVEGLKSPMRKEYPDDTMASNEILSTLAKVKISEEWIIAQSIISTSKPFSRIMNTTLTREMLLL